MIADGVFIVFDMRLSLKAFFAVDCQRHVILRWFGDPDSELVWSSKMSRSDVEIGVHDSSSFSVCLNHSVLCLLESVFVFVF